MNNDKILTEAHMVRPVLRNLFTKYTKGSVVPNVDVKVCYGYARVTIEGGLTADFIASGFTHPKCKMSVIPTSHYYGQSVLLVCPYTELIGLAESIRLVMRYMTYQLEFSGYVTHQRLMEIKGSLLCDSLHMGESLPFILVAPEAIFPIYDSLSEIRFAIGGYDSPSSYLWLSELATKVGARLTSIPSTSSDYDYPFFRLDIPDIEVREAYIEELELME